jgi:hypothetical protein
LDGIKELIRFEQTLHYLPRVVYAMIALMESGDYVADVSAMFMDSTTLRFKRIEFFPLLVHCLTKLAAREEALEFVGRSLFPCMREDATALLEVPFWMHWLFALFIKLFPGNYREWSDIFIHIVKDNIERLGEVFDYCDLYESQMGQTFRGFKRELLRKIVNSCESFSVLPAVLHYLFLRRE